jgi:biotin synthase
VTPSQSRWLDLADDALGGALLSRTDARSVLTAPDDALLELLAAAYRVRRHHWGNRVRLHFLCNAQSGLCPEDCHYCSQSSVSTAEIDRYPLLAREKILEAAARAAALKAGTFCLVISGRSPGERVFGKVLDAVREIRARYDLKVCACLGLLDAGQAQRLAEAGVETVNHNLNTSERHHASVCSTHTFADRRATVEHVKAAGIKTCSGGIIGMGESVDDRCEMLRTLANLTPQPESVPINALVAVKGTPLAEMPPVDPMDLVRMIAVARILMPKSRVRLSAGRTSLSREAQLMCMYAGANSIFYGEKLLTTPNPDTEEDLSLLRDAGLGTMAPSVAASGE